MDARLAWSFSGWKLSGPVPVLVQCSAEHCAGPLGTWHPRDGAIQVPVLMTRSPCTWYQWGNEVGNPLYGRLAATVRCLNSVASRGGKLPLVRDKLLPQAEIGICRRLSFFLLGRRGGDDQAQCLLSQMEFPTAWLQMGCHAWL
jgi:hypothetical protein